KEALLHAPVRPEGSMNLFGFLKARGSAPVARERLQILLAHERVALGPRDLVTILRDELLATIARHIEFDPEKLSVKMERSDSVSTLEIDVEIPCDKFIARPQASAAGRSQRVLRLDRIVIARRPKADAAIQKP